MNHLSTALWLLPLLIACGATRSGVDPTPPWATESGKEQAKTELAQALLNSGNPQAALRLIGKMRDQGARQPELLVLQGKAMAQLGLTDDAEIILRSVARRHPRQAEAHTELGVLLMDLKRIDEAVPRFRSAIRAAPKSADAHNNLGFALMASGQHAEAVEVLRKALGLDSSKARTRNNLGFALAATGEDKQAFRVLRAGTDTATAYTNLALAQELRGDLDAAKASYTEALSSDPDRIAATEALQRLSGPLVPSEVASPDKEAPSGLSLEPQEVSP
jgi:Flp pilus assembly protein TadD